MTPYIGTFTYHIRQPNLDSTFVNLIAQFASEEYSTTLLALDDTSFPQVLN